MSDVLTIGETEIPYEVRHSPRARRKRIEVGPEGVEVVAPEGTPREGPDGVHRYVETKRRWIFDAVRQVAGRHEKLLEQQYASGAKLQYRGRWLMLDVRPAPVEEVVIHCRSKFHVRVPETLEGVQRLEAIRRAFDAWLRERAKRDLHRMGRRHQQRLGVEAQALRLSDSKHRWGTCGKDRIVRVHWRLVQAPKVAMEYVVAHELVHLLHRNHSPDFWQTLGKTMPEWREAKGLLEAWEEGHRAL